jgi:hypothetical protein
MKKFSELKKKKVRRINEDANLPSNYSELSKEELVKMLQGNTGTQEEKEVQAQEEKEGEDKPELLGEGSHPGKLFSKLFESREMAHIYHLQVNGEPGSHAKHTALNDYYEGVLDFVDDLIETFQGQYGIVEDYDVIDTKETSSKDTIEYFNELARFIKEERKCINAEDTHLHNIIDEVVALVYRTLYKLKYNK